MIWSDVRRICFSAGGPGHLNADVGWVLRATEVGTRAYVEGYQRAAEALFDYVKTVQRMSPEYVVFPLAFLWRHHIELALKSIVAKGKLIRGEDQKQSFPTRHKLGDLWNAAKPYIVMHGDPDKPGEVQLVYGYSARARTVARRFDILGYTLRAARIAFTKGIAELSDSEREDYPRELLQPDGFDRWVTGDFKDLGGGQCPACGHVFETYSDSTCPHCGFKGVPISFAEDDHGFPPCDPLLVMRCLLERHPPDAEVTLDLSDLLAGGWVSEDEESHRLANRAATIIATEGTSDSRLLEKAVRVLYPEYSDFFSFIDYEMANARGGTAGLAQFVKMITGCRIKNRIVVLFDKDAAGHDALARLGNGPPANVLAMCLPPLDSFTQYPSVGPDGSAISNINIDGRACALDGSGAIFTGAIPRKHPCFRQAVGHRGCGDSVPVGRASLGTGSASPRVVELLGE
jgi:hypothetical protein